MSKPRDHHFIPVFYLKQWASSSSQKLIEYSIKHGKFIAKPVGPRGTGYETDLYSFPDLPPEIAQHIEDVFLRSSDNQAALALQRILEWDKSVWPPEMTQAWARCVMHLLLRHPDVIAEMRKATKGIWKATGVEAQQRYEIEIKKPADPDTFEEYVLRSDPHVVTKSFLNMIIRALDSETIGNAIIDMNWKVIDVTRSSKTLLTSDRPVIIRNLGNSDGWIALPITPTKLFFAVKSEKTIEMLTKGTTLALVERINEQIVVRARRYVWARDPWQEWYIRRNMGSHKEPTPLFPGLAKFFLSQ